MYNAASETASSANLSFLKGPFEREAPSVGAETQELAGRRRQLTQAVQRPYARPTLHVRGFASCFDALYKDDSHHSVLTISVQRTGLLVASTWSRPPQSILAKP